jgi:uncharacterized DUF497 family protein
MQRVERPVFNEFEWDRDKEERNIRKHGIDFDQAAIALSRPHLEVRSDRNGESRILAICPSSGRIIVIIYTIRGQRCRIISARAARKNEQRAYRHHFT